MMVLHFDKSTDPDTTEVIEVLKGLSLAYESKSDQEKLHLEDSGLIYEGKEAILKHLDSLEGELHNWYYCNC